MRLVLCSSFILISKKPKTFSFQCPECHELFTGNTEFMTHLKEHANPSTEDSEKNEQCRYCLSNFSDPELLNKHLTDAHPVDSKEAVNKFNCVICWVLNLLFTCWFL